MTPARLLALGFLLASLPLSACDDVGNGGGPSDPTAEESGAQYTRDLVFVARDATAGALLEFGTTDAGSAVRRSARGWAEGGSGWTPLYDVTWEGPALRRPWRLVPHGPIHLRVGLDEQLEGIAIRDGDADVAILEPGDFLTEWTPFHTSQVVLREATLALGTEPIRGWLVDASFGMAPQYTSTGDATLTLGPDSISAPNSDSALQPPVADTLADSSATSATSDSTSTPAVSVPSAASDPSDLSDRSASSVRTLRAVLFTEDGSALVLGDTDTGVAAWFWSVDEEMTMPDVTLTAVAGSPGSWNVQATGNRMAGRLEGLDEAPVAFAPRMVRGVFEIDGDTLRFHGVMRPLDAND